MWYTKLIEHFAINVSNVSKNNYVGILFLLSNKYSDLHVVIFYSNIIPITRCVTAIKVC
jgi:hypothetical protein